MTQGKREKCHGDELIGFTWNDLNEMWQMELKLFRINPKKSLANAHTHTQILHSNVIIPRSDNKFSSNVDVERAREDFAVEKFLQAKVDSFS